ncbi:hypothetical protein TNCV_253911 [Trichonephila clavipes]|nr:hypothetical protein TNCV_253911 [Trichonephila clavipes]
MINGRTRLHVVANGTMTGQRYIDEVLLPHVRLFRGAVGDKFVFMDDNATCHRTLAVQDCLDSEGIQRLVWPARSPDLNPIENVWDALGRQVAGRNYPPTNKNTLIRALTSPSTYIFFIRVTIFSGQCSVSVFSAYKIASLFTLAS